MFGKNKKAPMSAVGFYQALGAAVYISLVATFMRYIGDGGQEPSGMLGMMLALLLLVFSAAVCGSIIFGFPVYLLMHNRIKEALAVLGYTFVYFLFLIIILAFILIV